VTSKFPIYFRVVELRDCLLGVVKGFLDFLLSLSENSFDVFPNFLADFFGGLDDLFDFFFDLFKTIFSLFNSIFSVISSCLSAKSWKRRYGSGLKSAQSVQRFFHLPKCVPFPFSTPFWLRRVRVPRLLLSLPIHPR